MTVLLSLVLATGAVAQNAAKAKAGGDISGMYTFLQEGEFVQITVEDAGRVTGFVSRYGDLPSDKGAFLDQFFKKASLDGNKLIFTTEPVHGVWYEFRGTVARGAGKTRSDEGYYVLKGTLTQNVTDVARKTAARSREVEFKSFPQDVSVDRPKRD